MFVRAALKDLSKAFDCILDNLLITKIHTPGFLSQSLTFIPKRREQIVKINIKHSVFQVLLSGGHQGSILDPILFNIFTNDLFCWIKESELHNFADGNTI